MANVRAEWTKVIAIAPDSDVAKSVAQHLASLERRHRRSGAAAAERQRRGPPPARPQPGPAWSPPRPRAGLSS